MRRKDRGEIFIKKNYFKGTFMKIPVAIDIKILDKLLEVNCKLIELLIMGVKDKSYVVQIFPERIAFKGVGINYDRRKFGQNYSGWGKQIVFGLEWGVIKENKQKKLK